MKYVSAQKHVKETSRKSPKYKLGSFDIGFTFNTGAVKNNEILKLPHYTPFYLRLMPRSIRVCYLFQFHFFDRSINFYLFLSHEKLIIFNN